MADPSAVVVASPPNNTVVVNPAAAAPAPAAAAAAPAPAAAAATDAAAAAPATAEEKAKAAKEAADKKQLELAGGLAVYGKAIDKNFAAWFPLPAVSPTKPPTPAAAKVPDFSYIPNPLACCCGGLVAGKIAEEAGTASCAGRYVSMWAWSYLPCALICFFRLPDRKALMEKHGLTGKPGAEVAPLDMFLCQACYLSQELQLVAPGLSVGAVTGAAKEPAGAAKEPAFTDVAPKQDPASEKLTLRVVEAQPAPSEAPAAAPPAAI
jgi:hypothetical protein